MSSPDNSVTRRSSSGKESVTHVEKRNESSYEDYILENPNAWAKYRCLLSLRIARYVSLNFNSGIFLYFGRQSPNF